ncbi:unnamed protein product [Leptosia nina]|uniref:Uncharacterized protein n=1 Tax=Leptosia nina TaxID=320188 RepID=A0AAV1JV07_9NEOP
MPSLVSLPRRSGPGRCGPRCRRRLGPLCPEIEISSEASDAEIAIVRLSQFFCIKNRARSDSPVRRDEIGAGITLNRHNALRTAIESRVTAHATLKIRLQLSKVVNWSGFRYIMWHCASGAAVLAREKVLARRKRLDTLVIRPPSPPIPMNRYQLSGVERSVAPPSPAPLICCRAHTSTEHQITIRTLGCACRFAVLGMV